MKTADKSIRWLLFFACQTFLMSSLSTAGFSQETTPPSTAPANPPAAGSPQADEVANPNRTALVERLTDEIAALTPGNLKQPETLRGEISAAISLMIDNKVADAEGKLDALRKTYPQLPPRRPAAA